MDKIIELFGKNIHDKKINWKTIVKKQICPYTGKVCYKVRKSNPEVSIGTCSVRYGESDMPVIICPNRLLQDRKIFIDCLHLLHLHQPGNDIHIISELSIPGGSVDFVLTSIKNGKPVDFVGIELQALDTTGTIWPERQKFLKNIGFDVEEDSSRPFGMNWKMTAKTILVQLHHKIATFENLQKHLVLVIQDNFLDYMKKEFNFDKINNIAVAGDSLQFHSYSFQTNENYSLILKERLSTDSIGISNCLGLKGNAKIELEEILENIKMKITEKTLLKI